MARAAARGEKAAGEAAEGDVATEADTGTATAAAAPLKPEEPLHTGEEDEATEFQVCTAPPIPGAGSHGPKHVRNRSEVTNVRHCGGRDMKGAIWGLNAPTCLRWQADGVLYNFDPAGWKERGRGELRVNVAPSGAPRRCPVVESCSGLSLSRARRCRRPHRSRSLLCLG